METAQMRAIQSGGIGHFYWGILGNDITTSLLLPVEQATYNSPNKRPLVCLPSMSTDHLRKPLFRIVAHQGWWHVNIFLSLAATPSAGDWHDHHCATRPIIVVAKQPQTLRSCVSHILCPWVHCWGDAPSTDHHRVLSHAAFCRTQA